MSHHWNTQHLKYAQTEWINKSSLFAQYAIGFFPSTGTIIDIGCGQGQDSRFFGQHGYDVTGIDFSEEGIRIAKEKTDLPNVHFMVADISEPLSFEDESFDVVYSHLAIHYFTKEKTKLIFQELNRILKKDGILALFVNSIHDPQYETGTKIEDDYFAIGDIEKRYFSKESLQEYIEGFKILVLDEKGETYKDRAIGVSNLVQFIGKKV
jgi:SAM-dependent methyltransferase